MCKLVNLSRSYKRKQKGMFFLNTVYIHGYSQLADPFAETGIAVLINVISVQEFNCLSF